MNTPRVDIRMVRRPLPQGVAKADRTWKAIRTRLETIERERLRQGENRPASSSLPPELRLLADDLEYLGWDDLARLVHLELLALYRERETVRRGDAAELLGCLTRLRRCLVRLGRHDDAVAVAEEERILSLRLVGDYRYAPQSVEEARYAVSTSLAALGRHEEAAESAAAGVREFTDLPAKADPQRVFRLARAWGDYASRLYRLDRVEAAIRAKAEAAGLWRGQAGRAPVSVKKSLTTLGEWLIEVGRYDEAHAAFIEAVQALRRHVEQDEDSIWRFELPGALNEYADRLASLGRHREALAATEEAVTRHREVVEYMDTRLRRVLDDLAAYEHDEDDDEDDEGEAPVIPSVREEDIDGELEHWRAKVREKESLLCLALANHGQKLRTMGRFEGALAACAEAVAIARRYAGADPEAAAGPKPVAALAAALSAQARVLYGMGRFEEALAAAREAAALYTARAAGPVPAAYEAGRAAADGTAGAAASELGSHDEALAASARSLEIYRRLSASDPGDFEGALADALSEHGRVRSRRGEHEAALAAAAESVESYERLAGRNPGRYGAGCAAALVVFAEVQLAAGRSGADARAAAEKAVARYRHLAAELPEAYDRDLARARSVLRRAS